MTHIKNLINIMLLLHGNHIARWRLIGNKIQSADDISRKILVRNTENDLSIPSTSYTNNASDKVKTTHKHITSLQCFEYFAHYRKSLGKSVLCQKWRILLELMSLCL